MQWEKFKDQFHPSYHNKIKPFIESEKCDKIYSFLKQESRRGVKIAPLSNLAFRCFKETPLNEIKVIICGFCPYHTFVAGSPVADGLAMSCSVTGKLQPSLTAWYQGLENDLYEGLNLNYIQNPDLLYLAKQGVLLFNSSLTVAKDKAGSHQELWSEFTKYFFEEVVGYTGIPVIFLGNEAAQYQRYITPFTHTFKVKHPAFYARMQQPFDTEGVIEKVNRIILENNSYKIKWLCSQEEIDNILNSTKIDENVDNDPPF